MLTIKCSGCKRKLWKYRKVGPGRVLRCHKGRISKEFDFEVRDGKACCPCGQVIGVDMGKYFKMSSGSFVYTGTKDNS